MHRRHAARHPRHFPRDGMEWGGFHMGYCFGHRRKLVQKVLCPEGQRQPWGLAIILRIVSIHLPEQVSDEPGLVIASRARSENRQQC